MANIVDPNLTAYCLQIIFGLQILAAFFHVLKLVHCIYLQDLDVGPLRSDLHSIFLLQELVQTDHSKVYYASFRKNFYVEVPEIAKMTPEGKYCIPLCD